MYFTGFLLILSLVSRAELLDELEQKFNEAICKLQCYDEVASSCSIDRCNCTNDTIPKPNTPQQYFYSLKLKCKDENFFHVEWQPPQENPNKTVYFLHISSDRGSNYTDIVFCNNFTVEPTHPGASYNVTLWVIDSSSNIFKSKSLTVLSPNEGHVPLPVKNVTVALSLDLKNYAADVKWTPAEDLSCYYDIIVHCIHAEDNRGIIPAPETYEVTEPSDLFSYRIENLEFGYGYSVSLRAIGIDTESTDTYYRLEVPSCLETFKNISLCRPEKPQNLTVKEIILDEFDSDNIPMYDVRLEWCAPKFKPSYYVANLIDSKAKNVMMNITGEATSAVFTEIKLSSYYQVHLEAISQGGHSGKSVSGSFLEHHPPPKNKTKIIFILVGIIGTVCLVLLLLPLLMSQNKIQKENTRKENKYEKENEMGDIQTVMNETPRKDDKWEYSFDSLDFMEVLGEGAFGVVWKATLDDITVACKTLKTNSTGDEIRQLQQEIEIMKYVGSHPNIVSMIGCVTENMTNGPILIVEYCPKGDLLSYLRTKYNNIMNQITRMQENEERGNDFSNQLYELCEEQDDDLFSLTSLDVISFGLQISMGMEYLANQKVLHRDLAARNVLMCDNKCVKVSDFGLSRDVYMDSVYYKTTNGRLPIRWMAIESLTHQIYTSQSDVWSFGILLWEIVSLGAIPYPGVETQELLGLLKRGERMSKPNLCPNELYSVMLSCWRESPGDRPTFSSLKTTMDELLTLETNYLELNACALE